MYRAYFGRTCTRQKCTGRTLGVLVLGKNVLGVLVLSKSVLDVLVLGKSVLGVLVLGKMLLAHWANKQAYVKNESFQVAGRFLKANCTAHIQTMQVKR